MPSAHACGKGASKLVYAWGRNAPALELPENVGFRLTEEAGKSGGGKEIPLRHLVVQVHYKDVMTTPDSSGIAVNLTDTVQAHEAGVMIMAQGGVMPGMTTSKMEYIF